MKEMARYGFILAVICIIAGGLLAVVNTFTRPKILLQAQIEEQASLKEVMPLANKFEAIKGENTETIYYKAFDSQDKLIGFVFKAEGKGYSSLVQTLAGIFLDERISAIKVISQNETPGLGVKVTEPKFTGRFKEKPAKDLSSVEAVSGATISSRAVIKSIMKKAQEIKGLIGNER